MIVAGNWKMYLDRDESIALAEKLKAINLAAGSKVKVWIAPSLHVISEVAQILKGTSISVGSQNVHWESKGAFTGEVSAKSLSQIGAKFALVGHSERRHLFHESNSLCVKRAQGALASGCPVVYCIGETLEQREAGKTFQILNEQLVQLLEVIEQKSLSNLTIAYEPVWAIGTGKVATEKEISEAHNEINRLIEEKYSPNQAKPPVLYGGSVTPQNIASIVRAEGVSGVLVGGASVEFEKFAQIIGQTQDYCGQ